MGTLPTTLLQIFCYCQKYLGSKRHFNKEFSSRQEGVNVSQQCMAAGVGGRFHCFCMDFSRNNCGDKNTDCEEFVCGFWM